MRTPSRTRSRIAGTAAISVGLNIEASPFVPLFILFDVSVRVKGDPYPMEHPTAAIKFCKRHIVICMKTFRQERACVTELLSIIFKLRNMLLVMLNVKIQYLSY